MGSFQKLLEELGDLLSRLSEDVASGIPVVVEGKSDVKALSSLGLRGRFVVAKAARTGIPDAVLDLAGSSDEVIILTDFDEAGRELAMRWALELESVGLKANLSYWRCLKGLVGSFTKDIEGLPSLIETLMRKAGPRSAKDKVMVFDAHAAPAQI